MNEPTMPFDPNSVYYLWFLKWREHIRAAKSCVNNGGYCWAACIAQAEFVLAQALELNRLKRKGILKDE